MKTPPAGGVDADELLPRLEKVLQKSGSDLILDVVRILRESSDRYSWVGIYLVEQGKLVLAGFAGDAETQHVTIPIGEGICGSAAKTGETIVVPDVNKDPRYLMCFPSTRSEIVVPILGRKGVIGEIDIDSDKLAAFNQLDRRTLELTAEKLGRYLENHPSVLTMLKRRQQGM